MTPASRDAAWERFKRTDPVWRERARARADNDDSRRAYARLYERRPDVAERKRTYQRERRRREKERERGRR